MRQTVVGVFDRHDAARRAAAQLQDSGFGPDSVHVTEEPGMPGSGGALTEKSAPPSRDEGGLFAGLRSFFAEVFGAGPEPHGHLDEYAEAVRRGGAVVKVDIDDDARIDAARSAMVAAGAVDIEERVAEWRRGGWGAADAAAAAGAGRGTGLAASAEAAPVLPEAAVPARQSGGGVRVYARDPGEAWATDEAARRAGGDAGARGMAPSADERAEEFRRDFGERYAGLGGHYEDYEPHYRHGHALRDDARYQGQAWEEMEPELRTEWERRHPGGEWESYKEAVRRGWERIPV